MDLIGLIWFDRVLWHINHAKSSSYISNKYIEFGWVRFYGISTIVGYLMPNLLYTYIYIYIYIYEIYMIWFVRVLRHINHCRLFTAKSSLYIYIEYIGFGWVGFYGISTNIGYLMLNLLYTYILNICFVNKFC